MENKKIENQQISDNNAENVSGGIRIHVDTTDEKVPAKIDALYVNPLDYTKLRLFDIVSKDKKLYSYFLEDAISCVCEDKNLSTPFSYKSQYTTGKKKPWEIKIDIVGFNTKK